MKFLLLVLLVLSCQKNSDEVPVTTSINFNIGGEPTTLNPITSVDAYSQNVHAYVYESLLEHDPDSYEYKPQLATKYEVSKDNKVYTFTLRDGVTWHDGKPLTVEDIKFSYDVIFDPEYNTAHLRPYYEGIDKVEIKDAKTIQFFTKNTYYLNFDVVSTMKILPKHFYSNKENKKDFNKFLIGTGAYQFIKYEKGKKIVLERSKSWWGNNDPQEKGQYNFEKINLRFISDDNISMEMFKKGDLDFLGMRSEMFIKSAVGPEWGTKLIKVQAENKSPKGFSFIGWNLKNPILKDKNVRKALNMLYNRPLVNEKFEYNMSELARGPVYNQSDYSNKEISATPFNPNQALEILTNSGWKDSDGDLILDKVIDGVKTPLSFTILEPKEDFVKYLTVYKEDAKKVGVEINIKTIEWNSFIKLLDERKFEAVRLAWGGGTVDIDLKQIWHSASIDGGSNFISYKNLEVDKLIDQARNEVNKDKRVKLTQKVDQLIAEDYPYLFFFNPKYVFYAHQENISKPKDTFNYEIGTKYWSIRK
jgi:peptide/nickel transport system substrate-binding protein/microcin C transport system substrate-binding protein